MYINTPPASGRPAVGRAALRALEPDPERAHDPPERDLAPERAQHLLPGQRGRQRHVPPLER